MSMPVEQQPTTIYRPASSSGSHSSGSVGPLIVVLAVITILGVVAGMIGRLCAGRRFTGDTEYDFEGWIERKCATCIDGHLESGGAGGPAAAGGGGGGAGGPPAIPVAKPAENVLEPAKPQEGGGGGGPAAGAEGGG